MPRLRVWPVIVAGLLCLLPTAHAQPLSRLATTLAAVLKYPTFHHDKSLAMLGTPVDVAGGAHRGLSVPAPATFVVAPRTGTPPDRRVELRGRLYDIGRFLSDDSRLGPLNLPAIISSVMGDRWPARETLFVLTGATWSDPPPDNDRSLRAIALAPAAFEGREVTVRGRFRGRNLYGDAPAWPREGQWDFVLQAADAAVWILGRRPRGDGFDLSPTTRAHTGRWLEVTGRLEIRDELPVILASGIRTADPQEEAPLDDVPEAAPLPPPELIFSAPAQNEVLVPRAVTVRLQFSRTMDADSLESGIVVRYPNAPQRQAPAFAVRYRAAPMAAELEFEAPLAPNEVVEVEIGPTVLASDGVPVARTTLRFTTSGSSE